MKDRSWLISRTIRKREITRTRVNEANVRKQRSVSRHTYSQISLAVTVAGVVEVIVGACGHTY